MSVFYERYQKLCEQAGLKPSEDQAAKLFGTTRASISTWKTKDIVPKPQTLVNIANHFHVSVDYLLGRVPDAVDYVDMEQAVAERVKTEYEYEHITATTLWKNYSALDQIDKAKLEAFLAGLLSAEKYNDSNR